MLGKRLLIIEDDEDSLHAVSELLVRAGYEVLGAETGREGLRLLHGAAPVDLVLLDFWLPDMTGQALLATRTRWPGALSLPVLIVTGDDAWVHEHRDLRELGVVGVVRKPIDPSELLRTVERALAVPGAPVHSLTTSPPPVPEPLQEDALRAEPATVAGNANARHARRLSDLLTRASDLLAQSMDVSAQLRDIARLLVPLHADSCVFERSDGAGIARHVLCVQHATPAFESELTALAEQADGLGLAITHVLESGQPRLFEHWSLLESGGTQAASERLTALGFESVMIVPLIARRRVFGTLTCASRFANRRYTRAQLDTVTDLGHRVALALDNAELWSLAQQANRAREDLLAALSRDLRTPLSTIVATATKSLQTATRPSETEAASLILRNARNMEAQIRDLLDYAQLAAGHLRIELRKAQLGQVLQQVVDTLRPHTNKRVLVLALDPDASDVQLAFDPERIRQVVYTLIDRALRVTPVEGRVHVHLSRVEDELVVTVTDSATALSAGDLARLADCGQQALRGVPDLRTDELQLCVAHGLIEAHGGRLWFESEPGVSNAFQFALRHSTTPSLLPTSLPPGPAILLVDSDLAFRRELREILVERGYNVETADNGGQAWNYLQTRPAPALILLDLMLPVMDGWELHRAIKAHPQLASVPTVIVSGLDRYRIEASLSDAHGYIEKPIRTAQLFEVVGRYVTSPMRSRTQSVRPESNREGYS